MNRKNFEIQQIDDFRNEILVSYERLEVKIVHIAIIL